MEYNKTTNGDTMSTDMIGLANLLKSNNTAGMDLGAIVAMCNKNGFGGGQDFMTILILLLLLGNGGNLFGNKEAAAAALGGAENLQTVTSLYDRISAAQAATTQGFSDLNTYLCTAISNVLGAIRDQGDRNYDATRNVGDAVKDCCCAIEKQLISLGCKIDSVGSAMSNQMTSMEGRLMLQMERNQNSTDKQFCDLNNKLDKDRLESKVEAQSAEIALLKSTALAKTTSDATADELKSFMLNHFELKK